VKEMVLKVEKMLKEAQALPEVKVFQEQKLLQQSPLPPSPEPCVVSLPGELPIHVEVSDAQ
jgi:hypothetical protein